MDKKVIIYSTPTCHFCHMAKEFLISHNIPFIDYNVAQDIEKRKEMMEISGQLGVPVILIDDTLLIGFDKARLASLLRVPA